LRGGVAQPQCAWTPREPNTEPRREFLVFSKISSSNLKDATEGKMLSRKRPYPFVDEQHHTAGDLDGYQSWWQGQQMPIPNQALGYGYEANDYIPAEPIDFCSGPLILDDDAPFLFDQPRWLQPIPQSINGNGGHDVAELTRTSAEEQNLVCFGTVRPPIVGESCGD
jgi:hypothetical protein